MPHGLTLSYREDPKTGLPRLEDPSGALSADALADLGREVGRHLEHLVGGPDDALPALGPPLGPPVGGGVGRGRVRWRQWRFGCGPAVRRGDGHHLGERQGHQCELAA